MPGFPSRPPTPILRSALTRVLRRVQRLPKDAPLTILRRDATSDGTFPSEVVTCRLAGDATAAFFVKYETEHPNHAFGHRGGVAYEAKVYRHILQRSEFSVPGYVGEHRESRTGRIWLILEAVEGAEQLHGHANPEPAMTAAASWLGRFHRIHNGRRSRAGLRDYDHAYYRGWAERTWEYLRPVRESMPWIGEIARAYLATIDRLAAIPRTIIHGEFYPRNILLRGREVVPVDWESAALGIGEIDLAALCDGWPEATSQSCAAAYRRERWLLGPPDDDEFTLALAELYLQFRWLGDRPDWVHRHPEWRFQKLRSLGLRLGLI